MRYELFFKRHTVPVALAGQTGGAVRVVLDFFCLPTGRQAKKEPRNR